MVLTFNDIIYSQTFTIQAKQEEFDVLVSITDEESVQLESAISALMNGVQEEDAVEKIFFKEQLPKVKELLIGVNYRTFTMRVIGDYVNFTTASLLGANTIMKQQNTED